ncbi:MAG: hypothetical protein ABI867_31470 [Kofleriaceae bacterium]
MTHPKLDNLVTSQLLKREVAVAAEFAGLVRSGLARLVDAKRTENSFDSRFDLAYNAGHALALAALRWHGYRPDNKRYIVFQVLELTVELPPAQWRVLAAAHDKRNKSEYEGTIDVEPSLLEALVRVVDELALRVQGLAPLAG